MSIQHKAFVVYGFEYYGEFDGKDLDGLPDGSEIGVYAAFNGNISGGVTIIGMKVSKYVGDYRRLTSKCRELSDAEKEFVHSVSRNYGDMECGYYIVFQAG